jgi:signal transduction histidine kinase
MAMIRYGVAFPGALLSALALWQWSRPFGSGTVSLRRKILVCAMAGYAVLGGLFPVAVAMGPAEVVNADRFLALTRVPVQLVCSLWAGIVAVIFWRDYFKWLASRFSDSGLRQMLHVGKICVWVVLGLLAGSWIITEGMERECLESRDSLLLSEGHLIALSINPERIQGLVSPSTLQASQYSEQLTEQLQRVCDELPDIRYLYLLQRGEGGVRFLLDIEPRKWWGTVDIPNASPGDIYKEAPPEVFHVFKTGKALVSHPYRDKWGKFVSAFYPVFSASGRVVAVLGVDMDATFWRRDVIFRRMAPLLITAILITLVLVFVALWRKTVEEVEFNNATVMRAQRQQAVLYKIASLISTTEGGFDDLIREIVRHAGEVLRVDQVAAWCYESGQERLRSTGVYSVRDKIMESGSAIDAGGCQELYSLLAPERVVAIDDCDTDERVAGMTSCFSARGVRSVILAPYREGNKVAGMITFVQTVWTHQWSNDEVRFASEVADQISQMLINVRRREAEMALRRMNDELERRVEDRTMELSRKNEELHHEMEERLRIEAEHRQLEIQVQQKQKYESLGVMAGGIAHDFNNILMSIQGNVEMAKLESSGDTRVRDYLSDADKAVSRAVLLSHQMLAFAGRGHSVFQLVNLNNRVEQILKILEASVSKKIAIECDFDDSLPPVNGDPDQLSQVIMNLAMNAAEAIGEKAGVIVVRTGTLRCDASLLQTMWVSEPLPEGFYVFVEVADTGCGMDEATQARMFDPFFTTKFTGRGLGLATVAGIVRGHRGAIDVCSEVGKGSTLRVLFPSGTGGDRVKSFAPVKASLASSKRRVILVVDDEEPVRILGRRMLSRLGYEVMTASDGVEALAIFQEHRSDIGCVLLDMTMPIMDGQEVFEKLQAVDSAVKVIVCSGYNEDNIVACFGESSGVSFLQKPYSLNSLAACLDKVLA